MFTRTAVGWLGQASCIWRCNLAIQARLLASGVLQPTSQQFPDLKRGGYASISSDDLVALQGIIGKDRVITDTEQLEGPNTDWMKIYQGVSEVMVRPKTTEEVSSILRYCSSRGIAVCPQGGNTGLVGGSVPVFDELILSTSLMNKILHMDTTAGVLECQAGCVLESLEQYVNDKGFMLPIDLGAKGSCQIGGNVATNAGGVRFLRYGSLHGNLLGLEVVLSSGQVLDCMSTLKKDNTGYDLKQIFIGAEGTLGVITKVAIQCPRQPKSLNAAFLGCTSYNDVLDTYRLAKEMLSEVLSSFEIMDYQSLEPVDKFFNLRPPISKNNFYVLIEVTGSNEEHDGAKVNAFLEKAMNEGHVVDGTIATSLSAVKALWSLRENITPALQMQGYVHKHDLSLPANEFYEVVQVVRTHLKNISSAQCVGFGHMGDSNIHLNVIVEDPSQEPEVEKMLYPFLYEWVSKKGGSISAEHGIGLKKKEALSKCKPATSINVMKMIKLTLDPRSILNPYKIF